MLPHVFLNNLLPAFDDVGWLSQLPEYAAHEMEAVVISDAVLGVLELPHESFS
jgi:hypothetical protein